MKELRVWAPRAKEVLVEAQGERVPMEQRADGWWQVRADALPRGPGGELDYAFVLDDGAPLPDPRSPCQPWGVHGPSRAVDHGGFPWSDAGWQAPPLAASVIYELHVGTFTPEGTFDGVIDRLGHLTDLGVTHVELMPVQEFSGPRGWGYDGVDLFAPHHAYGGPDGLKRLVDACHRRGLGVILDVVYNHLGPEGNYLERFGPYFTDQYHTPWGEAINLDGPGSDAVRRFLCDNALMWLRDYHMDGLRIDAVQTLFDRSAVHLLEQLAVEVRALQAGLGRHLVLIAESNLNDPRLMRSREAGGYGLDAQWSDDLHHALHAFLTGERRGYYEDFGRLDQVAKALRQAYVFDGQHSRYRGRRQGRPAVGLTGDRFLGYLQTHDQVGNRARGDRLGHLVSTDRLKAAAALVLCAPFVPMLFQGEEWGAASPFQYFTSHEDRALGEAVREGRRREFVSFGWRPDDVPDPQAEETFLASRLDWSELTRPEHRDVLAWYRALLRIRRAREGLTDGDLSRVEVRTDPSAHWVVLARQDTVVVAHFGSRLLPIPFPGRRPATLLLGSHPDVTLEGDDAVVLPPDSAAVIGLG